MENFPSIVILQPKTWKNSPCLFHILLLLLNIMENKPKFKPNPKLRLMDQVRQVLRYHHYSYCISMFLDKPIGDNIAPVKAKKRRRPPVVMTKAEIRQFLNQMKGTHLLMAKVMYGGGLRLMECLRLRVMDLDFAKSQVYVRRRGKHSCRPGTHGACRCEDHRNIYSRHGEGYPGRE
jgi:integrase